MAASVPDDASLTISTEGTARTMASASSTSASVGAPNDVPRRAASVAAAAISSRAWPKRRAPHDCT
jgi:hypothetical protein